MAKWQCNTCGAQYSDTQKDGSPYAHACPPEIISHAQFDQTNKLVKAETRAPMAERRDENAPSNLMYVEGKPVLVSRDVNDATRQTFTPAKSLILSEGKGRTQLPDNTAL